MAKPKGYVSRFWKTSELRKLRALYGTMSIADLAALLGRPRGSVYRQAYIQGLHFTGQMPGHVLKVISSPGFIASRLARKRDTTGKVDRRRKAAFLQDADLLALKRAQLLLAREIARQTNDTQRRDQ